MRKRIVNNREQPVELHLSRGIVVLHALGEAEVELEESGESQLEALASNLRVLVLDCEPPVQEPGVDRPSEAPQPKRGAAKRAAAKRAGAKRTPSKRPK